MRTYDVIIGATHVYVESIDRWNAYLRACDELVGSGSVAAAVYDAPATIKEI